MSDDKSQFSYLKTFSLIGQLGAIMVFSVVLCTLSGFYLGNYFGHHTIFLVSSMIIGVVAGGWSSYRQLIKFLDL